jgi:integrase
VARRDRVHGPYRHGRCWRTIYVEDDGSRRRRSFATQEDAEEYLAEVRAELSRAPERTIDAALVEYEKYMAEEKGNKPLSVDQTMRRVRGFFPNRELGLRALDENRCRAYYEALTKRITRYGRPMAADTHRNTLLEVRSFLAWCVDQKKWLRANPLAGVRGKGRRKHGKLQLRVKETRLWEAKARELATAGEEGAIAALMALYLNMRANEIMTRIARDVDDDGRLLWIPDSKTPAGKRTLEVADVLVPFLLRLAEGKKPDERLFRFRSRCYPRGWVRKICKLAGVPVVCAHGLRGTHSSLAHRMGATSHLVALAMGHESERTTVESYTDPSALAAGRQRQLLRVLDGGRSGPPESSQKVPKGRN